MDQEVIEQTKRNSLKNVLRLLLETNLLQIIQYFYKNLQFLIIVT